MKGMQVKAKFLFIYLPLCFFSTPTHALDSKSCVSKSARLKEPQRTAHIKSCLAQISSPSSVKEAEVQHKRALCEQNARNYSLRRNDRPAYIEACMNENEAKAAAKADAERARLSARTVAKTERGTKKQTTARSDRARASARAQQGSSATHRDERPGK